jgi:hypothetical protein
MHSKFTVVLLVTLLASCSGKERSPLGPSLPGGEPLPLQLRFLAEAEGIADNGKHAACSIDTYIELSGEVVEEGSPQQVGTGGGDAQRTIEKTATTSVAFWAHTYFNLLEFHLLGRDSLEIRSPESSQVTDSRFWKEFALFAGHRRSSELAEGELARGRWTCHPMDTPPSSGEYEDREGSIAGTWVLQARHDNPGAMKTP